MAATAKTTEPKAKTWTVTTPNNPTYCGIDAGGVAFANGKAVTSDARMAQWFAEHPDVYSVAEN